MNIAQVAKFTGLPAKTFRYYEDIGTKIANLALMRDTLDRLIKTCAANDKLDCPISDNLPSSL